MINLLGVSVSLATGSHLHLDLLGTGAFVAVAWVTRGTDLRSRLSAGIVAAWALRLASFLFYRALQVGHDARLDGTLSTTTGAIGFWAVSFIWGVVTTLPHSLGVGSHQRPKLGVGAAAAVVFCAFGLYWEAASDLQKWLFKLDQANAGRLCTVGLWAYSQHPNYFGNLCLWSGILLLNAAALARSGWWRLPLAACGPLFLALLFFGQATGKIALSLTLAQKMYGGDPMYQAYVKDVPLIFPRLF